MLVTSAIGPCALGFRAARATATSEPQAPRDTVTLTGSSGLPLREAFSELVEVPDLPFDKVNHVVIQSHNDPHLMLELLESEAMPKGATVVTTELSLLPLDGELKDRMEELFDKSQTPGPGFEADCESLRNELIGFYLANRKTGGVPRDFLKVSRDKKLTLWLGLPRYDEKEDRLYNSMVCVKNGKVAGHHDKTLLWKGSQDLKVSDTLVFSPAAEWDDPNARDFETVMICWEAFNLNQSFGKPTKMPGVAEEYAAVPEDRFGMTYIGAYAPVNDGKALRSAVGRMARREDGKNITLGPHGGLAFVANGPVESLIAGPWPDPDAPTRKSKVYGSLSSDGFLHARSRSDGSLEVVGYAVDRPSHS